MQVPCVTSELEIMALKNEERAWVAEQIRIATERPEVRGIKRLLRWLREWTILGPLIVAMVAIAIFIGTAITRNSEFIGKTDARLNNVESSLKTLSTAVQEIRLKQVSGNPTDPQSIKEVQSLLRAAKSNNLKLSEDVLVEAGNNFVEATNKTPAAWSAALAFLEYRSFLNADLAPKAADFTPMRFNWQIDLSSLLPPPEGSPGQYKVKLDHSVA